MSHDHHESSASKPAHDEGSHDHDAVTMAASQAKGREAATAMRNTHNKKWAKYILTAMVLGVVLVLLNWWRLHQDDLMQPQETSSYPIQTSSAIQQNEARWEQSSGETLPVGVWSESTSVPVGCSITYAGGDGKIFKIQYRFYNDTWKDRIPNTPTNVSEVRFMMLQDGVNTLPYKMRCS